MVNISPLGKGANHNSWNTKPIAILVNYRRHYMIVETSPIIPREKNNRTVPCRTFHHGVDQFGYISLPR